MRALQSSIHGCTEVMLLRQAGHFVQEHGSVIARQAVRTFFNSNPAGAMP
jgi:tRNA(adenine34) deaminase